MKKIIFVVLASALIFSLLACSKPAVSPGDTSANSTPGNSDLPPTTVTLTFNSTQMTASDPNAGITVDGTAFVITRGGTYTLQGDLSNGQIRVSVGKEADVELIFNNFTASSITSAPIYIESANKAVIYLAAGTVNSLTDATQYQFPSPTVDKPNACIYSADDLTIKGSGTLNVNGSFNNGIGCKNDLRIKECTLNVSAPNNILKGNDSVEIESATVNLTGGEDAIKADTTDRVDKGYILIAGGSTVTLQCSDDALQATVAITVEGGSTVTGTCGGDPMNCPGTIYADENTVQISPSAQ